MHSYWQLYQKQRHSSLQTQHPTLSSHSQIGCIYPLLWWSRRIFTAQGLGLAIKVFDEVDGQHAKGIIGLASPMIHGKRKWSILDLLHHFFYYSITVLSQNRFDNFDVHTWNLDL
jgi:hypothetical protein